MTTRMLDARFWIGPDQVAAQLRSCPPAPGFAWARCPACAAPMRSDGVACTGQPRHPAPEKRLAYYATWTGTRANLAAMHRAGIRVLAGPDQLDRRGLPPLAWALDNGAWGAFKNGAAFDAAAFREVLRRWAHGADWIALPDIVAGGVDSLALSRSWIEEVRAHGRPMLLPVQDGMTADQVAPLLGPDLGIFVGGSTQWKWRTLPAWGELAARNGVRLHVARVNSDEAMRACIGAGASSADGTSATMFSTTAPTLGRATQQVGQPTLALWPIFPHDSAPCRAHKDDEGAWMEQGDIFGPLPDGTEVVVGEFDVTVRPVRGVACPEAT